MLKERDQKPIDDPLPNHPYALLGFGESLLIVSLAMDGLTGAIQDKMNLGHKTNPHFMMYNMNLWSCLWLLLGKSFLDSNSLLILLSKQYFHYLSNSRYR